LLKHVGVNLECINKSYYFFDAFVGYFTTIQQQAVVHGDGHDHCVQNHNFHRTFLFVFKRHKSLCITVAVRKVNRTARFSLVAVMVLHHTKDVFVLTDKNEFSILLLDQFKIKKKQGPLCEIAGCLIILDSVNY
jgi:hypothetical protein